MSATRTNGAAGTGTTATTPATFGFTATTGRVLLLTMAADDYRLTSGSNRPESSGFTLVPNCALEGFLGHYAWLKVASGGETTLSYTIGSASPSCWTIDEIAGLDTANLIDTSQGTLTASGGDTNTTPSSAPSAGQRLLIGVLGASGTDTLAGISGWTDSFTEINESLHNSGSTHDITGVAMREVTGNGSTTFSTTGTYSSSGSPAIGGHRTGMLISLRVATTPAGSLLSRSKSTTGGMRDMTGGFNAAPEHRIATRERRIFLPTHGFSRARPELRA